MSTPLTDAKVVLLSLLADSTGGGYWNEQPPANLPSNVKLTSSTYDRQIQNPQVVVGDQTMEPGEWISGQDYLMKPKCDVHTYLYRDLAKGAISGQDFGTLKKQEWAIIENIRLILTRHSDRPTSDCMFVFYDPNVIDRDIRNQREIMLHKIIRCTCWFVQTYVAA